MNRDLVINNGDKILDVVYNDNFILVNNNEYNIKILKNYGKGVYSLSVNNRIMHVQMKKTDEGFKLLHNSFTYNFNVKDKSTAEFEKYMQVKSGAGAKGGSIKSPMPGLIVKINCAVGDEVKKGDKLVIIEAMKMENAIASLTSGIVKSIKLAEGSVVEKDSVIIELE
ncbi:MAG: acetyl-CoA carboxylase biotin carboxyl carrier protein subunit [Candidatus Kapabacteria bacterium]|nr:acetyl-CoA carboxylase biotin carboxyl carrier protein subunit [Candidatus Kapabacteria bacterium]